MSLQSKRTLLNPRNRFDGVDDIENCQFTYRVRKFVATARTGTRLNHAGSAQVLKYSRQVTAWHFRLFGQQICLDRPIDLAAHAGDRAKRIFSSFREHSVSQQKVQKPNLGQNAHSLNVHIWVQKQVYLGAFD